MGEGGRHLQQRRCVDNKFNVDPVDILGNDNLDEPDELNFKDSGEACLGRNDVAANNQDVGRNQGLGAQQQGGVLLGDPQGPEVAPNHQGR